MRSRFRSIGMAVAGFGALAIGASARASMVNIPAFQDATLLGGADATTNKSLSDPGIFVGTDGASNPKRGLIEFNIGAYVPSGATITGATLQLTLAQVAGSGGGGGSGSGATETISLFDESQAWGQPTNVAGTTSFMGTGHGAAPAAGDATWNYAFYSTTAWTLAGGDWTSSLTDIADASVATALTSYTWSSSNMVSDVQNWLNSPSSNYGWILKNSDETDATTFRAFWSAQGAANNDNSTIAPNLLVTYSVPEPASASLLGFGSVLALCRRLPRKRKIT